MCSISLSLKPWPVSQSQIRASPVRQHPSVAVTASAGGSTRIHKLIEKEGVVLMPGCYDALSFTIVQKTGFSAGFISGCALSASLLAKPDFGLLTSLSLMPLSFSSSFFFCVYIWRDYNGSTTAQGLILVKLLAFPNFLISHLNVGNNRPMSRLLMCFR